MQRIDNHLSIVVLLFFAAFTPLFAGDIDLNAQNAAIGKLRDRIAARAVKLEQWKTEGSIGEGAQGLVEARAEEAQSLAHKKEVRDAVTGENEDRTALFREIVLANGLQDGDLPDVARKFAKSRRHAASPTTWVQDPESGKWIQKKYFKE